MTITFFGHRHIYKEQELRTRIYDAVLPYVNEPKLTLLVGNHGEYDGLVLSVCRELRRKYPHIRICVVLTSIAILQKDEYGYCPADIYSDVETITYDIEDEHFKNQIVVNNRYMVDDSDVVICYVNFKEYRSGAKRAVNYAKRKNKTIINLFKEEDRPFYGLTLEEREIKCKQDLEDLHKLFDEINSRHKK